MRTRTSTNQDLATHVKAALAAEPGLTVKDLALRVSVNRQYMAGFLDVLEEMGWVYHRRVGPARICFNVVRGNEDS